jgi:hypothetical protein
MNFRCIAARIANGKPLTPEEQKLLSRVNIFIMDWEIDGGRLPDDLQQIADQDRSLTPDEARKLIAWFNKTAPGNF